MAGLMVAVAVLVIFSTVAFQGWEETVRRDKEAEMIFRAQEIVRAIVRHRKVHGRLPDKLEDLMQPGPKGEQLLRHRYKDPLVKGGKWGLLYVVPGVGIVDPSMEPVDPTAAAGVPGSLLGGMKVGAADPALNLPKEGGFEDPDQEADGSGKSKFKSIVDQNQQVVGLNLAGVKSLCQDPPFRFYKGLTSYAEWRFTYADIEGDRQGGPPGQPGQPGQPGRPGAPGGPGAGVDPGSGAGDRPGGDGMPNPGANPRRGGGAGGPRRR